MKIGICYDPRLGKNIESFLNFASQWGFEYVLLKLDNPDLLGYLIKPPNPKFKKMLFEHDLKYIIHAPEIDVNPGSLNIFARHAARDILIKTVDIATEFMVKYVVISSSGLPYVYSPLERDKALANFVLTVRKAKEHADIHDVQFLIKNEGKSQNTPILDSPETLKYIAESLGVGIAFDAGNANSFGNSEQFVPKLGKHIKLVLLHDNKGGVNDYLPIGAGDLILERILYQLEDIGYDGPLIIENFDENEARVSKEVLDTALKEMTEKSKRKGSKK